MGDELATGRFVMSDSAIPIVRIHLDETINTVDHHRDVPQVQPVSAASSFAQASEAGLWSRSRRMSRLVVRRSPADAVPSRLGGETANVEAGSPAAAVSGRPLELILFRPGWGGHGIVELSCVPSAMPSLSQPHLRLRPGVWLTGRRRQGRRPGVVTAVWRGSGFRTLPAGSKYRDLSVRTGARFANADPPRAASIVPASRPLAAGSFRRQDRRLSR
jgi:hypothetical protein